MSARPLTAMMAKRVARKRARTCGAASLHSPPPGQQTRNAVARDAAAAEARCDQRQRQRRAPHLARAAHAVRARSGSSALVHAAQRSARGAASSKTASLRAVRRHSRSREPPLSV